MTSTMKRILVATAVLVLALTAVAVAYPPANILNIGPNSATIGGLDCATRYEMRLREYRSGAWRDTTYQTFQTAACADTTPPNTTITAGPAEGSSTSSTDASFSFSSTEPGTFECRLDAGAYEACSSPKAYGSLAVGAHSFEVRAKDAAGNVDPTPASRSWTVTEEPPPPPPSSTRYGFHQDLGYFGDSSFWNPRLDATKAIGSQVSRTTMLWSVVEPQNDNWQWARYDSLIAETKARGMTPIVTLDYSPQWANGSTNPWSIPSGTAFDTWASEYAEFVGQVAQHFAGQGLRYEIWNEPNETYFWQGSAPSIDRYAQLFTGARNAILAADSQAQVGLGGITGLGAGCCISGRDFISGLVDRGVQFDYAGIHPYVSGLNRGPDTHVDFEQNFDDTKMIHDLLVSRGRLGVKLWLTEWGWYGCSPDDATKAAWLKRGHERIRDEWSSFVDLSTYFMDQDQPAYSCAGVLRSDLSRKPLADAFAQFMGAVGG